MTKQILEKKDEKLKKLISFRKELHKNAELSGQEKRTKSFIHSLVTELSSPDEIIDDIGGNSLAFRYKLNGPGNRVLLRADMDALPIEEQNNFSYRSTTKGVSHKCGHDGHSTILAGFSAYISKLKKKHSGEIILLFQSAEETGQGAQKVVTDSRYKEILPEFVFGLHNLPGYAEKSIIIKKETFAAASIGLILNFSGKSSHASEPEKGISPALCIADNTYFIHNIKEHNHFTSKVITTVIHSQVGERAFGTSPGQGHLMATLRAFNDSDLEWVKKEVVAYALQQSKKYKLEFKHEWTEEFPETKNHPSGFSLLLKTIQKNAYDYEELREPFRWSEDFGHYLKHSKGAFFGIGAGKEHPHLHANTYDFNDDIISTGINFFYHLAEHALMDIQ